MLLLLCASSMLLEFPVRMGSPRVAPTQGRTVAGQLDRGSEVVLLLLWDILATSGPECEGRTIFATDWIHRRVMLWCAASLHCYTAATGVLLVFVYAAYFFLRSLQVRLGPPKILRRTFEVFRCKIFYRSDAFSVSQPTAWGRRIQQQWVNNCDGVSPSYEHIPDIILIGRYNNINNEKK